jgi:FkbM family methyltransferase
MERIPPLFDPSPTPARDDLFPAGSTLPLAFRTTPQQWGYAARFDRRKEADEPVGAVLVSMTVRVESGSVGIGCLNDTETEFIDETFVSASPNPTRLDVVIAAPSSAGPLVIRNTSPEGASTLHVLDLEYARLATEPERVRAPGLSEPRPSPKWSRFYGVNGVTPAEKLRAQQFRALQDPQIVTWVDGLSLQIQPGDQLSRALYVSGTYEPNTLSILRRLLKPGDTFFDVGANVGVISLVASRWVGPTGRVYSFEPSLREHDRMLKNLETNDVGNVQVFRVAVTAGSGVGTLRVASSSHAGLNTLGAEFAYEGIETDRFETVETTSLDEFVERYGIGQVSVVKVDVEGAESAAVAGAERLLATHRPALIIEVFSRSLDANGASLDVLETQLRDARYRLFAIDDTLAELLPLESLAAADEQNIVGLPVERTPPHG